MTELKFKRKKAGKTVGYTKIAPGPIGGFLRETYQEPDDPLDMWWLECPVEMQAYDSIHQFVCQDHAGNDLYEGDRVVCGGEKYTIHYQAKTFEWVLLSEPAGVVGPYAIAISPERVELLPDLPAEKEKE